MQQVPDLIPAPVAVEPTAGSFGLADDLVIYCTQEGAMQAAERLQTYLRQEPGITADIASAPGATGAGVYLLLKDPTGYRPEEFNLQISPQQVILTAGESDGLARGIETLRQLLLLSEDRQLPCLLLRDYPRYQYRGMHLDVSRHFFPKEFILRYIDLLALYRFNRFHWHLVDDNGWRIEIERYPRLTAIGAWRADRKGIHWMEREPRQPGEAAEYGGFYSHEDIREIVSYAADREIEIIPEIEMPGHTMAALAAYPEYSCTGGPFEVCTGAYWPITDIFCAGNETTFEFLENILLEVMELFPGESIHIGGDEADKSEWRRCERCQERITAEGLADEAELQSWFIRRIDRFLTSHNRKLIGWDEILEGGLAPEATVMSWRGFKGGIAAAEAGHDVIMTPVSHCYFDYYQADPEFEPVAIGGYLTLQQVYSFDPTPPGLSAAAANHVLGGQGNVWSEYMPDSRQVEYMVLPRLCAMAEALWSSQAQHDWPHFRDRLQSHFSLFERLDLNYSRGSFRVTVVPQKVGEKILLTLTSEQPDPEIRYSLDGSEPGPESPRYQEPLIVTGSLELQAAQFEAGARQGRITAQRITKHLGTGRPVHYSYPYSEKYPAAGPLSLTDGIRGEAEFRDPAWQGFEETDLEITIDLGETTVLNRVTACFIHHQRAWIFLPESVEVALSDNGSDYVTAGEYLSQLDPREEEQRLEAQVIELSGREARYLRVRGINRGSCPDWHPGAGGRSWLFVDEIVVE